MDLLDCARALGSTAWHALLPAYMTPLDVFYLRQTCRFFYHGLPATFVTNKVMLKQAHVRYGSVSFYSRLFQNVFTRNNLNNHAIKYGRVDFVKFFNLPYTHGMIHYAARRGHVELVQLFLDANANSIYPGLICEALKSQSIALMVFLKSRKLLPGKFKTEQMMNVVIGEKCIPMLQWIQSEDLYDFKDDTLIRFAAKATPDDDTLKFLVSLGLTFPLHTLDQFHSTVPYFSLDRIKFLKSLNCPWHSDVWLKAIMYDRVDALAYFAQQEVPFPQGPHFLVQFASQGGNCASFAFLVKTYKNYDQAAESLRKYHNDCSACLACLKP